MDQIEGMIEGIIIMAKEVALTIKIEGITIVLGVGTISLEEIITEVALGHSIITIIEVNSIIIQITIIVIMASAFSEQE